jgi:hypothetical protein
VPCTFRNLRGIPIVLRSVGFEVVHPCFPEQILPIVLDAIIACPCEADVDFFCLVPTYVGTRFLSDRYIVTKDRAKEMLSHPEANWEAWAPKPIADNILALLPSTPFHTYTLRDTYEALHSVYNSLTTLDKYSKVISPLKTAPTAFEQTLYDQHRTAWIRMKKSWQQRHGQSCLKPFPACQPKYQLLRQSKRCLNRWSHWRL